MTTKLHPASPADTQEALDRIVAHRAAQIVARHVQPRRRVHEIVDEVAAATGISATDIHGKRRMRAAVAEARHLVMWRAHREGISLSDIGRALGRDHSSVSHGVGREQARQDAAPCADR